MCLCVCVCGANEEISFHFSPMLISLLHHKRTRMADRQTGEHGQMQVFAICFEYYMPIQHKHNRQRTSHRNKNNKIIEKSSIKMSKTFQSVHVDSGGIRNKHTHTHTHSIILHVRHSHTWYTHTRTHVYIFIYSDFVSYN